ncbi:hypothetical protein HRbin29_02090 [bacterium HR29]|nr:hypothetical protein HRbin29_02090 [bacterium HR29]
MILSTMVAEGADAGKARALPGPAAYHGPGLRDVTTREWRTGMWSTIGWLTLLCGVFIGMLIGLSIVGLAMHG